MKGRLNRMVCIAILCSVLSVSAAARDTYTDRPFVQDFSEKAVLSPSLGRDRKSVV
jgi:hypothetical protein